MLTDYETFERNSTMLVVLNRLLNAITFQTSCPGLQKSLYQTHEVLKIFTRRFSLSESSLPPSQRKDIYAFINKFIMNLVEKIDTEPAAIFKAMLPTLEPDWTALCKTALAENSITDSAWGKIAVKPRP